MFYNTNSPDTQLTSPYQSVNLARETVRFSTHKAEGRTSLAANQIIIALIESLVLRMTCQFVELRPDHECSKPCHVSVLCVTYIYPPYTVGRITNLSTSMDGKVAFTKFLFTLILLTRGFLPQASAKKHPVILVPGLFGSQLFCKLDNNTEAFHIWLDEMDLLFGDNFSNYLPWVHHLYSASYFIPNLRLMPRILVEIRPPNNLVILTETRRLSQLVVNSSYSTLQQGKHEPTV